VPARGFTNGDSRLLDKDEENARPECGAVDFAGGPAIVGDQCAEKNIGESSVDRAFALAEGERQSRDGDHEDRGGRKKDVALVGRRIESRAERELNKRAEQEHVR